MRWFELACVVIVVATLAATARRTPARALLTDYALLAVAGFVGEQSCITLYRFYSYADGWDLRVIDVPLLVPLIWPLVILSARDVVRGLAPGASPGTRSLLVGAAVIVDASLVEVIAVRAGLWSWAEGGHLGVPLIGIAGWGFFAGAAELVLERAEGAQRALVIAVAPAIAHALIVLSWWALLRWTLRGDLGVASSLALVAVSSGLTLAIVRARRAGGAIPMDVAAPRIFAAMLFFYVLVRTAPLDGALWLHVASVAVPYLVATRWGSAAGSMRYLRAR
jgi:hypothetical protein